MLANTRAFGAPKSVVARTITAAALVLGLAACGSQSTPEHPPASEHATSAGTQEPSAGATLELSDVWAKAAVAGEEHAMTGIFGKLHNPTDAPITVTSVVSDAAHMVELHETVMDAKGNTVMQPVEAGFEIAPGATLELVPGEEHIMLMGLTADLIAGDQVQFTLTLATGESIDGVAEIRDYKGAQETYSHEETEPVPDGDSAGHGSGN